MSQDTQATGTGGAGRENFLALLSAAMEPATLRAACEPEAAGLPDIAGRCTLRLAAREQLRQANIERILQLAAAEFVSAPTAAAPDPAWLARFWDGAQDAADDPEQSIWARLLAKELAAPGAVARRTLGFLAEMEPWEVAGFIEYCAFAFAFESGWRFMFDEETARRELWTYGRELDLTQHFIAIGLLAQETGTLGSKSARGLRVCYRDRVYELRGREVVSGAAYRKFTPLGQQLAEAVRTKTFNGYARNLIKALNSAHGLGFEWLEPPVEG